MKFLLESYSFKDLIEEVRDRGVKVGDIFQLTPHSKLINPQTFLKWWFNINGIEITQEQVRKLKDRVVLGIKDHQETLEGYLDTLGQPNKQYNKIPPAEIYRVVGSNIKNPYIGADGKHRAMLALLLGIDVPYNIKLRK